MAYRMIPPSPNNLNGRIRETKVVRDLVFFEAQRARSYNRIPTGGSGIDALLGPDLGNGQRTGSATTPQSLQPLMGHLNGNGNPSGKSWVAGHLLNADWGGNGSAHENLTPLTAAANSAHKSFEAHIKRMLLKCRQLDEADKAAPWWYGVRYRVKVSDDTYADRSSVSPQNMYSYVYSHISLEYQFVKLPKFPDSRVAPAWDAPPPPNTFDPIDWRLDPNAAGLRAVGLPNFSAPSNNIRNFAVNNHEMYFQVEIHNEE